ncbi:hypothetical protein AY600_02300 [Phormidium willei BDU 130791]|nr:hypothetical protein AY600_02300 [Phormidium willei BDU 130791]
MQNAEAKGDAEATSGRRRASPQRDRLVETAAALFHRDGLNAVGVNRLADEAAVARMTLYNNFPSKQALVLAVLDRQSSLRQGMIDSALAEAATAAAGVRAFFDLAARLARAPEFRGCVFINAAAQTSDPASPVHARVRAHKGWIRQRLTELLAKQVSTGAAPELAEQILLLWDGALMEAYLQGTPRPIAAAARAAEHLLRHAPASDT